jgi:mannose-6-phosphate isomerase-like protein (cupin superfamily)
VPASHEPAPSPIRIVAPGGGELIGDSPRRRVEILSDADPLHATISRFGPGRDGADLHVHTRHSDLFYVLEGELTVRLGVQDERIAVPAGSLARVPPNVVHGFRNATGATLRFLNLHAPGCGFADYMRALRDGRTLVYDQHDPPADGGRPISDVAVEASGETDVEAITVTRVDGSAAHPGERLASYYVLEGELRIGGERAPAGAFVQASAPHTATGSFLKIIT